ncbi:hypothetical protein B0B52_11455 [Polaromonas sp. A23]|nr:hypothetical protein B0B52_11455 [Polaromonas sp. A23]
MGQSRQAMTPTLFTAPSAACNALPPVGAARLRPGKAGSAARTGTGGEMSHAAVASRGRGSGSAGPQAQRPPRGAGSDTKCATVGAP